jgi:succinate dehydrogenase / fumarate reductase iron-sulfur subunit
MIGVPILLGLYAVAFFYGLNDIRNILLGFALIGLGVFGIFGIKEVYVLKRPKKIIKLHTKLLGYKQKLDTAAVKDNERIINLELSRFNPQTEMLENETYDVKTDRFSTVLDCLLGIKANNDPTLSVRYSCRMGVCGSCGMVINGRPSLACETNAWQNSKNGVLTVSPMLGHPLLKDLVTDFDDFFEKHTFVDPHIFRKDLNEKYHPTKQYEQTNEELNKFLPFSYCIMCGLCTDACPVVNTNPEFLGPQALSQTYRYYADSRDQAESSRLERVDISKGVWNCEFAGSCSKVCPKGVDPAFAIQLLKTEIIKKDFSVTPKQKL